MQENDLLLYITSSGRSGSTLIDMLLGGHSKITSTGEFHRLSLYSRQNELCTCGQSILNCTFWQRVARIGAKRLNAKCEIELVCQKEVMVRIDNIGRVRDVIEKGLMVSGIRPPWSLASCIVGKEHREAAENSLFWLDCIRAAEKTPVVVDSTKDVRRLKLYYLRAPKSLRVLYLVRDGRAVTASAIRRSGCDMTDAARIWVAQNRAILAALSGMPRKQIHFVRYEDFCKDPKAHLESICYFLGLTFEPQMLRLNKAIRHNIGGNPMRFRRHEQQIKLDERWKKELGDRDLVDFSIIGGKLTEQLGYV